MSQRKGGEKGGRREKGEERWGRKGRCREEGLTPTRALNLHPAPWLRG